MYPTVEWQPQLFYDHVYQVRLQPLIAKITGGGKPIGRINLFSQIPADVMDPSLAVANKLASQLWRQIEGLMDQVPELAAYNFEFEVVETAAGRGRIIFTYSPNEPTTEERSFPSNEEPPSPEEK